jgi:hypothetical protein
MTIIAKMASISLLNLRVWNDGSEIMSKCILGVYVQFVIFS